MKNPCFFLSICLYLPFGLLAQPGDLTDDRLFFEEQAELYQSWLDREGLGQHLKVRELQVEPDHLSLFLQFRYQDLDSMVSVWDQVKAAAEVGTGLTLEEQLFYKVPLLMEVRQARVDVQLYDTYDLRQEPLFFRGIYFDEDSGKVIVETSDPRSKTVEIRVPEGQLPKQQGGSITLVDHPGSQALLFERIVAFAKETFETPTCEDREPTFKVLQTEGVLRFRAYDLCRVVLVEETRSVICQIFGCNDIVRELLEFTITYEPTYTGAKLNITIDGKFGSGFYDQVRRGAYHDMTEEPDFENIYLKEYADDLQRELKRYLQQD